MKEVEELYGKMLAVFEEKTGFTMDDTADLAVRLYAAAAQIQSLYAYSDWAMNQSFPQTATGEYLDYHAALRGITRKAGTSKQRRANPEGAAHPGEYKAEKGIIAYLTANPDDLGYIESKIDSGYFVTDFNRKVFEKITEKLKNTIDFDVMSLQSEFSADEMGKITEIIVNNRNVDINRSAVDDYIKILSDYKDKNVDVKEMSNDDFRSYFENLKKSK